MKSAKLAFLLADITETMMKFAHVVMEQMNVRKQHEAQIQYAISKANATVTCFAAKFCLRSKQCM